MNVIRSILGAGLALTLQLGAQQPPASVAAASSIEGVVLETGTDRPIADVRLVITNPLTGAAVGAATSDAQGRFVIKGLVPGSHRINTTKDGYAPARPERRRTPGAGIVVTVGRDQQVKDVAIRLDRAAVITGRIFDTNGSPVLSAQVSALPTQTAYDDFGEKTQRAPGGGAARTDDRGEYRIYGLAPGEYYVKVTSAFTGGLGAITYVVYHPSGTDLARAQAVRVRNGEEVSLATVYTPIVETAPFRINIITDFPNESGQTRGMQFNPKGIGEYVAVFTANRGPGAIEHPGLPLGVNEVRVALDTPDGVAYGETSFQLQESFDKPTVDLVLRKGGRFSAQALLEKADGVLEPLPGVRVSLGVVPPGISLLSVQTTGADGSISIPSTPPGEYRMSVSGIPETAYIDRMSRAGGIIHTPKFAVAGDTRVEIVAKVGGGNVEGVVKDSRGRAVSGGMVALVPAESSLRDRYFLYRSTTSDQDGKFTLRSVAPGSYKVFAWLEAVGAAPFRNAEFLAKYEERGKVIQIQEGQSHSSEIQVADEEP